MGGLLIERKDFVKKILSSLLMLSLALGCCAPCSAYETEIGPAKNKTFAKKNANAGSDQSQRIEFKEIFKKCKNKIIDITKNIANYKHIKKILVGATVAFFLVYKAFPLINDFKLRCAFVWQESLKSDLNDLNLISYFKKVIKGDLDMFDECDFKLKIEDIIGEIKAIFNFNDDYWRNNEEDFSYYLYALMPTSKLKKEKIL